MLCDFYNHSLQYQESMLAKYYVKQHHEVTVIASTFESAFDYVSDKYDSGIAASEHIEEGVKIIKLPYSMNILNKLRRFKNVSKLLRSEKPDLIFSHDIHLNLLEAVKYKKRNPNIKLIMDYHADYSNSAKNWVSLHVLHKAIRRPFLHYTLRYIDKIYPVVPASFVFLNEVYGIPYERMELLPLGVDTDVANKYKLSKAGKNIKNALNIQTDEIIIFTGGKLNPAKKTHLLLEAFLILNNPKIHLIVVGDTPPEETSYKKELDILANKSDRIHFTGWLKSEDTYKYMDAADLAVFPASQSVLWQQAIGMGLPLIIGNIASQDANYLNRHNNVIIMEEKNITSQEISKNISALVNDPQTLDAMRKGATKTAQEFLSYDKIAQQTLQFNK